MKGQIDANNRETNDKTKNYNSVKMELGILGSFSVFLLITTLLFILVLKNRKKQAKHNLTEGQGKS